MQELSASPFGYKQRVQKLAEYLSSCSPSQALFSKCTKKLPSGGSRALTGKKAVSNKHRRSSPIQRGCGVCVRSREGTDMASPSTPPAQPQAPQPPLAPEGSLAPCCHCSPLQDFSDTKLLGFLDTKMSQVHGLCISSVAQNQRWEATWFCISYKAQRNISILTRSLFSKFLFPAGSKLLLVKEQQGTRLAFTAAAFPQIFFNLHFPVILNSSSFCFLLTMPIYRRLIPRHSLFLKQLLQLPIVFFLYLSHIKYHLCCIFTVNTTQRKIPPGL